jgi:hypothetical protein
MKVLFDHKITTYVIFSPQSSDFAVFSFAKMLFYVNISLGGQCLLVTSAWGDQIWRIFAVWILFDMGQLF